MNKVRRFALVLGGALTALALGVLPAFATPAEPAEQIMDAATTVATTNGPLILTGLVAVFVVGLGVRIAWTAYANARKGVSTIK